MTIKMFDGRKVKEISFLDNNSPLEIVFEGNESLIVKPYSDDGCGGYLKGKIKVYVERELDL